MVKIQVNSQGKAYYTTGGKVLAVSSTEPVINSLNVTPTTSAQTITAPSGVDGYSPVNVSAVTSSIDANIQAGNIKKDVAILGVTGIYEGSGGSSTKYGVSIDNILGDVDASGVLQVPSDINGITFTGVEDVAQNALYYKFYYNDSVKGTISFPDLTTVSGKYGCYYTFYQCTGITSVSLPELTTVSGDYGFNSMFYQCTGITSVSLPKLTTVSGKSGCESMFGRCTALTSVSLPELTTVSGNSGCSSMFTRCTALTSVSLPKLTTISGSSGCNSMVNYCTALTDVYFNALTTTSFGTYTNQFVNMLQQTGSSVTHTLHFPSNLESTIQGLDGYPNFGGSSSRVVLAYDLPATS